LRLLLLLPQMMPARVAVLLFAAAATPALAEGFYVAAEVGVVATDDIIHSDPVTSCGTGCIPSEASLDGLRLDSQETAWGISAGWNVREWLSVELAFTELGEPGVTLQPELISLFLPAWGVVPVLDPDTILGEVGVVFAPADFGWAALGVQEFSVNAMFRHRLGDRFSAWWLLGVSRGSFDAQGYVSMIVPTGTPGTVEFRDIPFQSPDAEMGYRWGFGAAYLLNERFSLEVGYRRHELEVVDTESLSLRILLRL
jgi:opacity protein-like surface antigen